MGKPSVLYSKNSLEEEKSLTFSLSSLSQSGTRSLIFKTSAKAKAVKGC